MRVLIVADVVGGVRTFVSELSQALTRDGIEVHLALIGADAPRFTDAQSCSARDLRLEWMDDPWHDIERTSAWVEELRQRYAPDVLHMNTFAPVLDAHVPVVLTVHSCVLTWWRAVHGHDAPAAWARYAELVQSALARCTALTVPTRALLNDLRRVHGALPPARVIPNGRALPIASHRPKERLVVAVGRLWDEAKNAAGIARAASSIDARVLLIGPGHAAGVECLGSLAPDEVLSWLRRASVFVEPARYEPFGLAALEAALSGCALVLGDIPSLREIWRDAAWYVPPDDRDALARAVNALLDDPPRRARAAYAARIRAGRYSPNAMARAYADVYRQIAHTRVAA
jgi:glycosyltransferase involved in cell wall biosynthesis